jgi:hypothetical protein
MDYADSAGQSVQLSASQGERCSVDLFSWNVTRQNGFNESPLISTNPLRVIYSAYQ